MPTKKLTSAAIPHLPEGEYYDLAMPGLILRVGRKRRVWSYRYRAGGSYRRAPLGYYPVLELAAARDAARDLMMRVDSGLGPVAAAPHPRSAGALTLGGLLDDYEAMRLREGGKIKALPKVMRLLRLHLKPHLTMPAAQFSKNDLRAIRNELVVSHRPTAANKLVTSVGTVLQWAAEEDLVAVNFASAIRKTRATQRARTLDHNELSAIWRACDDLGSTDVAKSYGRMVKFLLVTAQRRDEVASLKFGHILNNTWKQTENKASRPHSLPLPDLALSLIGCGEARDLVFPGRFGDGKLAGFSNLKDQLDRASGVTGWVHHDLRRTAASNMQELEIAPHIVQMVLNHAIAGVGQVYLRATLEKQKALALQAWADEIVRIVGRDVGSARA